MANICDLLVGNVSRDHLVQFVVSLEAGRTALTKQRHGGSTGHQAASQLAEPNVGNGLHNARRQQRQPKLDQAEISGQSAGLWHLMANQDTDRSMIIPQCKHGRFHVDNGKLTAEAKRAQRCRPFGSRTMRPAALRSRIEPSASAKESSGRTVQAGALSTPFSSMAKISAKHSRMRDGIFLR